MVTINKKAAEDLKNSYRKNKRTKSSLWSDFLEYIKLYLIHYQNTYLFSSAKQTIKYHYNLLTILTNLKTTRATADTTPCSGSPKINIITSSSLISLKTNSIIAYTTAHRTRYPKNTADPLSGDTYTKQIKRQKAIIVLTIAIKSNFNLYIRTYKTASILTPNPQASVVDAAAPTIPYPGSTRSIK